MTSQPYMPQSKSQEWGTPDWLFESLDDEFDFTLDAAASDDNALCKKYYTKEMNGLTYSWVGETVFINPPFEVKMLTAFARKAYIESENDSTEVVMLVPVKSDQAWWHDYAMKTEIRFIKGRIKFKGAEGTFPGPIAVLVFGSGVDPKIVTMLRDGTVIG